ncbi:MAG TPA: transglycosylase family protein [Solirubrobacteraceae bacterium]|nr:transglycosylase family protein [Solirubrobacteraceae bacterium]
MRLRTPPSPRLRAPALAVAAILATIPVGAVLAADRPAPRAPVSPALRVALGAHDTAAEAMRGHARDRVARRHVALTLALADLSGRRVSRAEVVSRARGMSPRRLRAANRRLRAEVRELDVAIPPVMHRIAECESHGDPRAIGGGGAFRGALQFMQSTWESVGGEGDPAAAPREEQLRRGAVLMARSGSSPWPHCGA